MDISDMEDTLLKIENVLGEIKRINCEMGMTKNQRERNKIIDNFKKKYKRMSDDNFKKRIDLTAPKADRKPEIGLTIIQNAKNVVFQDKAYKAAPPQKEKLFKLEFKKKLLKFDDDINEQIKAKKINNLELMVNHIHKPEMFKCKKYNIYEI